MENRAIEQIDSNDGVIRLGVARLVLYADDAIPANLGDTKTLRVLHFLQQDFRTVTLFSEVFNRVAHTVFNNVVAKHDADGVAVGKMLGQPQSLGDAALA